VERHLTATGFVVDSGRVLLHWHRKNRMWLPFGGHIEPNEDPVQAVRREVEEECGLKVELLGTSPTFGVTNLPSVAPPVLILLEPVTDGVTEHEHIDLIYFCRPNGGTEVLTGHPDATIRWVSRAELEVNEPVAPLPDYTAVGISEDVRMPALAAIDLEADLMGERPRYR
jgi:8-oxo-dGTP diphosphatase